MDVEAADRRLRPRVARFGERLPSLERGGDVASLVGSLARVPIGGGGSGAKRERCDDEGRERPACAPVHSPFHSHSIVPGGFEVTS